MVTLALLASVLGAVSPDADYLPPGTPAVDGLHDLVLIYHGQARRPTWNAAALAPYVAHLDADGKPTRWLFDGFLLIEFATDRGAWIHHYRPGATQPNAADWTWLADAWFRPGNGLEGLEQAVEQAGAVLGDREHGVQAVITLPLPLREDRAFGPLPGLDRALDLADEANRRAALTWYLDRVLASWRARTWQHVRLSGFYWTAESIGPADRELVRWTADELHHRGLKLYWIPYFGAAGQRDWQALGIDGVMLQPNHFFGRDIPDRRLTQATEKALANRCGVEVEFDGRAVADETFRNRFYAYLDAGASYGWMNHALLGYYEGGGAIGQMARGDAVGRELYEDLCRFVWGEYQPRRAWPALELRDRRGNLALAARGARIAGPVRRDDQLDLVPEKILDGEVDEYGGMSGFGYFAWPGSFVVELPEEAAVSRCQTQLWGHDDRFFRYRIETSLDGATWQPAVDKSEGEWRGWQVDQFPPRRVRYVRFTGLYGSANTLFQVVEFEVYANHLG